MYLGHIGKYWYIYIKAYKNRNTCIDISIPLEVIFSWWWFSLVGSAILEKDFPKAKFFSRAPLCNCSSKPLSHSTQISSTLKQQLHSIKQNIPVCLWAWKYTGSWYVKNTKKHSLILVQCVCGRDWREEETIKLPVTILLVLFTTLRAEAWDVLQTALW